jgi:hypothetical protein
MTILRSMSSDPKELLLEIPIRSPYQPVFAGVPNGG